MTEKNFGRDRRYPITNRFRDSGKPLPKPDDTLVSRAGKVYLPKRSTASSAPAG